MANFRAVSNLAPFLLLLLSMYQLETMFFPLRTFSFPSHLSLLQTCYQDFKRAVAPSKKTVGMCQGNNLQVHTYFLEILQVVSDHFPMPIAQHPSQQSRIVTSYKWMMLFWLEEGRHASVLRRAKAISEDKRSTILKFGTHCAKYKYTSASARLWKDLGRL